MQIKDISKYERPREKAFLIGLDKISSSELLAIIIKSGTKDNSSLQIAYEILKTVNGIANLHMISFKDLNSIKGLSKIKSLEILAAIELAKRISFQRLERVKITNPNDIVNYFSCKLAHEKQEHFVVILLNTKGHMLHYRTIFIGTLNYSLVHPREVFGYIVSYSCASFICLHNHPSGCVQPSQSDIEITDTLFSISNILQIKMLDHIIVGDDSYFSFKENNLM